MSHQVRVYFGDLNFRINMKRTDILQAIKDKDYNRLMAADELYRNGMSHSILKTCQEGQLLFDPTYKYDFAKQDYDTSAKKRSPAWTDRVLY